MGNRAKPTALKLLQGNPGKRKINKSEPKPDVAIPVCPSHLDKTAKSEWRRVVKLLKNLSLISEVDRSALAMYCQSYARWVDAELMIERDGFVIMTATERLIKNPNLAVANEAMATCHKFMTEFGMTPSSRSKLHVDKPAPGGFDEF